MVVVLEPHLPFYEKGLVQFQEEVLGFVPYRELVQGWGVVIFYRSWFLQCKVVYFNVKKTGRCLV